MASSAMEMRQCSKWQYSLKSLMFVTTLVAVCAALVQIALPLAVITIPLIAAALVRTMLMTSRRSASDGARPRLIATFCYSVCLLVVTILMCLAAASLAGIAAALIATTIVRCVFTSAGTLVRPIVTRAWLLLLAVWNHRAEIVSRLRPGAILDWLQLWSVVGTLYLLSLSRRLFRQCWCCPSPAAFV
jgi:hypothetical protein